MEHAPRRGQPRRAAAAPDGIGRRRLHRPALQHRQRLRVRRSLPRRLARRPVRRAARRVDGDDASAPRGRPRGAGAARSGVRQHRRQRGGPPAAADGRGLRGGQLPRPGRGQPQPEGPPARPRVRDQPRVRPGVRPPPAVLRGGRGVDRGRRRGRLPAGHARRATVPLPAAAQHQQEVHPVSTPTLPLPAARRPGDRSGLGQRVRRQHRADARLRRRPPGGVAVVEAAGRGAPRRPGVPGDPGPQR